MRRLLARMRSFWHNIVHRSDVERNISDELQFHVARHADHLISSRGVSQDEATRIARLEFGSMERYKEEARQSLGLALIDGVRRDLRYACRTLAKDKGFTAAALLILVITIGANSAVYTLVDRLLMRPLPYPQGPVDKLWMRSCYREPRGTCHQEPHPRAIRNRKRDFHQANQMLPRRLT